MTVPDASGHFGPYGGRYVPETLVPALDELTAAWQQARRDPVFAEELTRCAWAPRRAAATSC